MITLAFISIRCGAKSSATDLLTSQYVQRSHRLLTTTSQAFHTEAALLAHLGKQHTRTPTHLILLDPRGKLLSSEAFAAHLGRVRDSGTQHIMLAIGPADGWTDAARDRADLLLSLGPMTLPHELARVVLAEQVYRALTILAGHPYHSGH